MRAAAALTLQAAGKRLDFYLWWDRSGFLITSVCFPEDVGRYPCADSFWVQRAQNPLWRVVTAEAETWEEEGGGGEEGGRTGNGENSHPESWIDYLQDSLPAAREEMDPGW